MAARDPLRAAVRRHRVTGGDATTETGLRALAERLDHRFAEPALLHQALTHRSAATKSSTYERLEFLGDRVLGLVVAHMLFEAFPREAEGALAKRYAVLVRRDTLAEVARRLDLGGCLLLARNEEEAGARRNASLLADACEAVIAALYLDGGLSAAEAFVRRHWRPLLNAGTAPPEDPKTALQEVMQGRGLPLPVYRTVNAAGPPHDPVFEIEVEVEGHPPARAKGRSKRGAATAAAALLLKRLRAGRHE